MDIKVRLSSKHYLLDGLVYSADNTENSPLAIMASLATGDVERLEFAAKYNLVTPGTEGTVIGTTVVNGSPRFSVQFQGASGSIAVPGKFIEQAE